MEHSDPDKQCGHLGIPRSLVDRPSNVGEVVSQALPQVQYLAVVQARMSSTRFPGKVLALLEGKPMVLQQLVRVTLSEKISKVVVATSIDSSDDQLALVLESNGYDVIRGSLADVLDRYVQAIDLYNPQNIVRITADCPLISPKVIDQVITAFEEADVDYLSNTMTPTFPDGLDVEVVKATVLRRVGTLSTDPAEREHVTLGVYRNPQDFSIGNFSNPQDYSKLRWTVDTPEDFAFVSSVYADLYPENHAFEFEDILNYLERNPELVRTEHHAKRNAALDGLDTGAMNA
ncbi:MAG: spore coat protein [Actinobacteria bacterium]|nr:spore coat protein [Actinomycetota bacterium]